MKLTDLKQMYLAELQELHSAEDQLVSALPKMAEMAADPSLKEALTHHVAETTMHRDRVGQLLQRHNASPREHRDQSMETLIRESEKFAGMIQDPNARDAGLIGSAQCVEHYEIASYGTVACWAKQLGLDEDVQALVSILEEEKRADEKLTQIAKSAVNPQAA